jgi:hypothetical protein
MADCAAYEVCHSFDPMHESGSVLDLETVSTQECVLLQQWPVFVILPRLYSAVSNPIITPGGGVY